MLHQNNYIAFARNLPHQSYLAKPKSVCRTDVILVCLNDIVYHKSKYPLIFSIVHSTAVAKLKKTQNKVLYRYSEVEMLLKQGIWYLISHSNFDETNAILDA